MKAIVRDNYGSADVLKLEDVNQPTIGDDQVLLRVHSSSINVGDQLRIRGQPYVMRLALGLFRPRLRGTGLDVAGRNRSCDEIGGDYFDFIRRADMTARSLSLVVGDVSGHGLDAALLMTTAWGFLRMRASQGGTLGDIVEDMNRHLVDDLEGSNHFMTLFFLTVDLAGRRLEWVRAGHDPAQRYDPVRDRFDELEGYGLALGIDDAAVYPEATMGGLAPGQVIAVGTDGIWEARDRSGVMFGKARFKDLIRRHHRQAAGAILEAIFQDLAEHTRGGHAEDDMTLVIVKIEADPRAMSAAAYEI